ASAWINTWPDGLVVADREHRVVFLSAKATELLGWTTESAAGRTLHELLCARSRECFHSVDDCPLCAEEIEPDQTSSTDWITREGVNVSVDYRIFPASSGAAGRILTFYDSRQRLHSH